MERGTAIAPRALRFLALTIFRLRTDSMRSILAVGLALATLAIPRPALAESPRDFLQKALEGDNSEIMLGRLAADRAHDDRVIDFGRTLSDDHSQAREEVIRLGSRMGVRRNRDIAPEAREERDRLQGISGREFDREFIRYMIQDHEKDIADFREEAQEGHGPVSDLAARQLPTLQKHLEIAMELDRNRNRGRGDHNYENNGYRDDGMGDGDRRDRGERPGDSDANRR
jgi:putative membrane protein